METVAARTLAPIFTGRERGRDHLELPPGAIGSDDLAREPGSFIILGRALARQREDRPSLKLVEGLARRSFRLSLGVLLEGLSDAGEGDGGHFCCFVAGALTARCDGVSLLCRARGDQSAVFESALFLTAPVVSGAKFDSPGNKWAVEAP